MTTNISDGKPPKVFVTNHNSASLIAQGKVLGGLKRKLTTRIFGNDTRKHLESLVRILQTKQSALNSRKASVDIWETSAVKDITNVIDAKYGEAINNWKDSNGLDILHFCILYDGSKFLKDIFSKGLMCPEHKPITCPYAHLAAILNHSECLRVVLTYRPQDYYTVTDMEQSTVPCFIQRQIEQIKLQRSDKDGDLKHRIKNLLSDLIETSQETSQRLKLSVEFIDTLSEGTVESSNRKMFGKSVKFSRSKPQSRQDSKSTSAGLQPQSSLESVKHDGKKEPVQWEKTKGTNNKDNNPLRKRASIFRYEEPFSELSSRGVLGGAGSSIDVFKPSDPAMNISLKTEKTETSNQRSTVSSKQTNSKSTYKAGNTPTLPKISHGKNKNTNNRSSFHSTRSSINKKCDSATENDTKSFELKPFFFNESPLTIAAARGYYYCVKVLLSVIISKIYGLNNMSQSELPLTIATKAKARACLLLLFDGGVELEDYQSAVSLALTEQIPDCLSILLTKVKPAMFRKNLFDGENLFNVLYAHSNVTDLVRLSLPIMTKTLIACDEPVKCQRVENSNFPVYTLICCAFKDATPTTINQYILSLHPLIDAGAEPDCKETLKVNKPLSINREKYSSVSDCILTSAVNSQLDRDFVRQLVRRFFVEILESQRFKERRFINNMLFKYMQHAPVLGLDVIILRLILQNGADPKECGVETEMYPVNIYFEYLLPFLRKYEVEDCLEFYSCEIDTLAMMFRLMPQEDLHKAMIKFMDRQMGRAGSQAVPIVRYFCHVAGQMVTKPRTLRELSATTVWTKKCHRNYTQAKYISLHLPEFVRNQIIP